MLIFAIIQFGCDQCTIPDSIDPNSCFISTFQYGTDTLRWHYADTSSKGWYLIGETYQTFNYSDINTSYVNTNGIKSGKVSIIFYCDNLLTETKPTLVQAQ